MAHIKAGSIRKGMYILFKNKPFQVVKTDFMSPGKGSAFMRCKLKDVVSGTVQDFTYKSTESVEELDIQSREMQFLYAGAGEVVFMDGRTFEQVGVPRSLLVDQVELLTPEITCYIIFYDGEALGVTLPPKVSLKVVTAHEAASGNTMGQARKMVELETGMQVSAPVFVKTDDVLVIDTATKQYVSRGS
ncbi:MAG: elongation factor P [Pseudomonadales bacterium]|nr:elongation factor P [Candidatus Woesebacteria bacterium]MCB9802028.1 elongation factor P [Pseudomonadales bacterium]